MNAKETSFYDKNRQQLYKVIPLDMPFTCVIEPSSKCNLRCNYCAFSKKVALKERSHIMENMSNETFALIVSQLKEFPRPFKNICFTGLGEPLMNPLLPDMIKTIKDAGVSERVILITNAANLTYDNSLGLVDAGLDAITISVNGLNADDYEKFTERRIDYDKFIKQIAFLYANKRQLRVDLKTIDLCINSDDDKKYFFNTFGNICDRINVETVAPIMSGVTYDDKNIKNINNVSKYSEIKERRRVCSQAFYRFCISSLGKVNFCDPVIGFPYNELDISKTTLKDIWNGTFHKQLQLNQLQKTSEIPPPCKNCPIKSEFAFEEDNLDPFAEDLYQKLKESEKSL